MGLIHHCYNYRMRLWKKVKANPRETLITLASFLILVVLMKLFADFASSDQFENYVTRAGIFGPLLFILYIIFSHVFAPITGSPAVIVVASAYGVHVGMSLLYIASMISAVINFYLARKYGRPLIKKLTGEKGIKEIDRFTKLEGREALIFLRFVGFPFFDFISYAVGLTKIPFKTYMTITAIMNLFGNVLVQLLFYKVDLNSTNGIFLWFAFLGISSVICIWLIKRYLDERRKLLANTNNKGQIIVPKIKPDGVYSDVLKATKGTWGKMSSSEVTKEKKKRKLELEAS